MIPYARLDHVYMAVCQALTGQGGWPLTIIMPPDYKPFFAGTYFPKHCKWNRPGLMDILTAIQQRWESDRDSLLHTSTKIVEEIKEREEQQPPICEDFACKAPVTDPAKLREALGIRMKIQ